MALGAGSNLGPYRIIEVVGRGGMATVYKAFQASLKRFVAIKVLPEFLAEDQGFRTRFEQEAVAVASLRHPNILTVYDHGEQDGLTYIVTEFVDGGTLADQLGKPLPVDYAVQILGPIASALDYAHGRGVLHRDLKPSNVLIAQDGTPILSDFGLALMMTSTQTRLTLSGTILGTPEYMSPEQCEGAALTAAADIYSLGVVAYEMLTGRVPFSAATPAAVLIAQIQNKLPPPREVNPSLSPPVESALLKALAKGPSDRFRRAEDFIRALTADMAPEAVARVAVAPATGVRTRPARAVGGFLLRRLITVAMAIIVLLVAGGAAFLLYQTFSPAAKRTASGASPKPSTVTTSSPTPSHLVKGALVFQAKLDGTGGDLFPTFYVGDPGAVKLSFTQGAIEIAVIRRGNASTGGGVNYRNLARYATEVDFSVQPGSDLTFVWVVRSADPTHGNLQVEVNAASESMHFAYFEPQPTPTPSVFPEAVLSTEYHIAGLQTGRTFTLSALVDPPRYVIYLDGIQVFAVSDARGAAVGVPAISGYGTGGVLRVTGIRIYTLP